MTNNDFLGRDLENMGPEHDRYDPNPPKLTYLIISQPRTGSSLLASILEWNGLGKPREYLNRLYLQAFCSTRNLTEINNSFYIDHLFNNRKSTDGTFGIKVHLDQLLHFLADGSNDRMREKIAEFCARFDVIIFINRRDKLAQAVSLWRSLKSGLWASVDDAEKDDRLYSLSGNDFAKIFDLLSRSVRQDLQMQQLFNQANRNKLQLWYEDMLADKKGTMKSLAELFNMPDLNWKETTKVMRNNVNEDLEFQILNRLLGDIDAEKIFPLVDR
jgi:LPS sulfotransferase NodH